MLCSQATATTYVAAGVRRIGFNSTTHLLVIESSQMFGPKDLESSYHKELDLPMLNGNYVLGLVGPAFKNVKVLRNISQLKFGCCQPSSAE